MSIERSLYSKSLGASAIILTTINKALFTHMSSLLMLATIGLAGFLCQWLAQKVKLPAILFLLVTGLFLGPVIGILDPDLLFGELLFPYISLSVAVILFEGALTLRFDELKEIGKPVRNMVTYASIVNAVIITIATHYLIGLTWELSALFGAIMVVTGPTVIMPMLKTVKPNHRISDVLRWEGIVIDPIGALFAVLVFEWIAVQRASEHLSEVFIIFTQAIAVGALTGLVAGYAFGWLLRRHLIAESIQNFASLSFVCFVFAVSDSLAHESGLLAVTVMGVLLANMRGVHIHSILDFKEDLTVIFVSALFIILAARLDFSGFTQLGFGAVFVFLVMQFIARPIKVALSFIGSDFTFRERAMIAWIGPRGIVAAAVTAVFALKLSELGFEQADLLVPLAFSIIIGTVVFQSLTARPIAKLLDVAQPNTPGVVIVGSNVFSITVAEALKKAGVETIICGKNWDNLRPARLAGLKTYYGNPSSDHASLNLNLAPYGIMLGLSNHHEYNISQVARFRDEFGSRQVFTLPATHDPDRNHKHLASEQTTGQILFGFEENFSKLRRAVNDGNTIRMTEITEEYSLEQWKKDNPASLKLFTINKNGDIQFKTAESPLKPTAGTTLFYFIKKEHNVAPN